MTIDERLLQVFKDVFGPAIQELHPETSPDTVEGWDSKTHVSLVLALEAEFDVQFDVDEIAELTSAAAIRERLDGG